MAKKDLLDEVLSFLGCSCLLQLAAPFILVFLIAAFIYGLLFSEDVHKKYEGVENIIFTSELKDKAIATAKVTYDKDIFESVESGSDTGINAKINYTFSGRDKTVLEYEELAKKEVTKLYDMLKGYTLVSDQGNVDFSQRKIEITFYLSKIKAQDFTYLGTYYIKYTVDAVVDDVAYEEEMNKTHIDQNTLERALRGW